MKKKNTFKTPMMENCNNNFPKKEQKFKVAVVGLQVKNNKYVLNNGEEDAGLCVIANKGFTSNQVIELVNHINESRKIVSVGAVDKFKSTIDGIEFDCRLGRIK